MKLVARIALIAVAALLVVGITFRLVLNPTSPNATGLPSSGGISSQASAFRFVFPPCGSQDSQLNPLGCWAAWIGYLPTGYVPAPHYPNAPIYPCLPDMSFSMCRQFQASCGNGVCDPNESCSICPIDCGTNQGTVCNPYTGRAGPPYPVSGVCFVGNSP
jgi:hypothetical protein